MLGYLLPFTPFQEIQYKNRDTKYANRYLQTLPIAHIKPISSDQIDKYDLKNQKRTNEEMQIRKIISEITGKGMLFDDSI